MSQIPRTRILSLMKAQCSIFNTVFNPDQKRQGTKVLRERLKGPTLAAYYPRRVVSIKSLQAAYPGYEMLDEAEQDRLEKVRMYVTPPASFLLSLFLSPLWYPLWYPRSRLPYWMNQEIVRSVTRQY